MSSSSSASASATTTAGVTPALGSKFKIVGILLAVVSGLLIGSSFVFKKKGLQRSQQDAGEGVAYLKSPMWWTGMTMMILGEICNFVAYAFVEAIVVTPLGALSVVICAILSSIFLKEKLSFFGWVGCGLCIVGSTTIALNGPQEPTVGEIKAFEKLFLAPGFLIWAGALIVASLSIIFYFGPKYGKQNMLWYIAVCSMIGGLSVSCTTGLGAAIVTSITGENQFKFWFIYFLLAFVSVTLVTEVIFLNKALALFNTAMVTPTYYVIFTFCTLVTTVVLFDGLKTSATQLLTIVCGFLTICAGITILQMSKVDPTQLNKLDRKSTLLLQAARQDTELAEKSITGAEDPGIDALRGSFGTFGSMRRIQSARRMSISSRGGGSSLRSRHNNSSGSGGALYGDGGLGAQLPGIGGLQRHQLYDAPVPRDELGNPVSPNPSARSQGPRTPTVKFGEENVAHYYPSPGIVGGARHEHVRAGSAGRHPLQTPSITSTEDGEYEIPARSLSPQRVSTASPPPPPIFNPSNARTIPQSAPPLQSTFYDANHPGFRDPFQNIPATSHAADFSSSDYDTPTRSHRPSRQLTPRRYPKSHTEEDQEESIGLVERSDIDSSEEEDVHGGIRLVTSTPSQV
ncbi:DUF803-domain-containing protein [Sistotremastrum niveocremeum HHB9708]|uniref:DUF803-domain-containing protein n=2 Tax=Sistotremastraceae TaxID=3402574 RepID=A0A165A5T3_9AGAM|nr:DUF803-domain-containing protein [Sistotremastrum niveocremeum HHB9708]KZT43552.1 DUF803-domain-containing protein [Sistotremastrum suecicum HHB10207 ss-3]